MDLVSDFELSDALDMTALAGDATSRRTKELICVYLPRIIHLQEELFLALERDSTLNLDVSVRRVPREILLEIFLRCVDTTTVDIVGSRRAFSRVCREWRNVACGDARLWSSFRIPLFGGDPDARLLMIDLHLKCSGNAALTIHLDSACEDEGSAADVEIALLASHAHRIHTLRFLNPLNTSVDALRGKLRSLEVLEFGRIGEGIQDTFMDAPRLHTVEFFRSDDVTGVDLPGLQIRTLIIRSGLVEAYLLRIFPRVISVACVPNFTFAGFTAAPSTSIFLQHIEIWKICCWRGLSQPMDFFDSYTAPVLRCLELSRFEHQWSLQRMHGFLLRSRCNLTELILTECFLPAEDLFGLWPLLPRLRKLDIRHAAHTTITNQFMQELMFQLDQPFHLPRLETLHIEGSYILSTHTLLEMLESRTTGYFAGAERVLTTVEVILRDRLLADDELKRVKSLSGIHLYLLCLDEQKID
ncbi:hypothetical protein B0H11DRAFT_2204834 [Mycena galericulata]|nr:hypothetical protein B0H11DRAFT_2204834 [Mycena galericulata]